MRAFWLVSALAGLVGPVGLLPVTVWLDSRPHTLELGRTWESVFTLLWPASIMLMAGAGTKPFSAAYTMLLLQAVLANVVLFVFLGTIGGWVYLLWKRMARDRGSARA